VNLLEYLKQRAPFKSEEWLNELENRKREESYFHSFGRKLDSSGNLKFYKIVGKSKTYVRRWLRRNVIGKVFLDYACGEGRHSMDVLENSNPAITIGLDISSESIRKISEKVKEEGYDKKAYFFQGDCEETELPDSSIDVILCSEMLHHLDVKAAFRELHRILAPGGRVMCVEALGINPIIQWYRRRTPQMRTEFEKEHILTLKSLDIARSEGFTVEEIKFWHFFAIPAAFFSNFRFYLESCWRWVILLTESS
jgi:ubiquinone/menaquinone biosynthesis C-methylase UbiE